MGRHRDRQTLQMAVMVVMVLCFWLSFYSIYWRAAFFDRVRYGFQIFAQTTKWYDWIAAGIYLCCWTGYNLHGIKRSIRNSGKQCCFMLKCCQINPDIECRFNTPDFDAAAYDANGQHVGRRPTTTSTIENLMKADNGGRALYVNGQQPINVEIEMQKQRSRDQVHEVGF